MAAEAPKQQEALHLRLLTSAKRLERIADRYDVPGFSRLAFRDLAAQCRAQAASLPRCAA